MSIIGRTQMCYIYAADRPLSRTITVEEILCAVSRLTRTSLDELKGKSHRPVVAQPRQLAMFLANDLTLKSLAEIGRRIGNRHYTTVLHAKCKIMFLALKEGQVASDIAALRNELDPTGSISFEVRMRKCSRTQLSAAPRCG